MIHRPDRVDEIANRLLDEMEALPSTQEEMCLFAAMVSIEACGRPETDREIQMAAYGLAQGLLGNAFGSVDDAKRISWIDECEHAIRVALG
jgi:hypothetical protein